MKRQNLWSSPSSVYSSMPRQDYIHAFFEWMLELFRHMCSMRHCENSFSTICKAVFCGIVKHRESKVRGEMRQNNRDVFSGPSVGLYLRTCIYGRTRKCSRIYIPPSSSANNTKIGRKLHRPLTAPTRVINTAEPWHESFAPLLPRA